MRTFLVAAAATAAAGALAGSVAGAHTSVEQIAFANAKAIYVIGADGSGLRRVTHSPYSDFGIAWSRDGKLLAFSRYFKQTNCPEGKGRGDLYLIGSNGNGERRLTRSGCMFVSPRSATFAFKGATLAFDDDQGIIVAHAPGWEPHVAIDHGFFPSWAPDARRVVYEDGPTVEVGDTVTHKVGKIGNGGQPAWSHGGGRIVCVASNNQLWTTDATGKHGHKLVTKPHIAQPAWSPDDKLIAFSSTGANDTTTAWVVPAAGGKLIKLGPGGFPAWSSRGDMLSVENFEDGYLYLVRPDGTGRHRLTKGDGAAWRPAS